MKSKYTMILMILLPGFLFSQSRVNGKIVNENNENLEYVNVAIKDSIKIIGSSTTDKSGEFAIKNIKEGKYSLEIYHLGYKNEKIKIDVTKDSDLGLIKLNRDVELLAEVELSAKVPVMESVGDKLVMNIENNPFVKGRMTDQLLNYAPFMTANRQEGITLFGETPLILINDRRIFMSGSELVDFLSSIPAEDIKNIEIYTTPPARFDAEGVSGVVNININKQALIGIKGSLANISGLFTRLKGREGMFAGSGVGGSISYRDERWHVSSFARYNRAFTPNLINNKVDFRDKGNGFNNDNEYQASFTGKIFQLEIGRDIMENQNIVINYMYNSYLADDESKYLNREFDSMMITNKITKGYLDVYDDTEINSVGINYNWDIDKKGHTLILISDYYNQNKGKNQTIKNAYFVRPNIGTIDSEWNGFIGLPIINEIYSTQIDYSLPTDIGKFSFGGKYSVSSIDSRTDYYDINITTRDKIKDNDKSIDFSYSEHISALYFGYNLGGLRLGLRYEYTDAQYIDRVLNQDLDRSYGGFFPSISYTQKLFENRDAIILSYNRRLRRPQYSDFNGLFYFSENQMSIGYPNIRPSFPNRIQLTYNFMKKYSLIGEFNYTPNMISQVTYQIDNNTVVNQKRNIDDVYQYRLSTNINQLVYEWWNINFSANITYNKYYGNFIDNNSNLIKIDNEGINSRISLRNMINVYGINIEVTSSYIPEGRYGYIRYYERYILDFMFTKTFINNKLLLGVNLQDIFSLNKFKSISNVGNTINFYEKEPIGAIVLNIRYNFEYGRKDIKEMKSKQSIEDEKERI